MSDGANKGSFLSFVDLVCASVCVLELVCVCVCVCLKEGSLNEHKGRIFPELEITMRAASLVRCHYSKLHLKGN